MTRWILVAVALWAGLAAAQDDRLALARKLSGAGQYAPAIAAYQKVLESTPAVSQIWLELAETRMAANQYGAAMGDFSRAVRLEPTNLRAQRGLAIAAEKNGNLQRALLEWRRAVQLAQGQEQAEAEANVARILALLGQASAPPAAEAAPTRKAVAASEPAKVKTDESDPVDVKKAVKIWKEGKRDEALEMLRGIIKKKPSPEAYYYAGLMRYEEKKLDMAEFNVRKALADKELGGAAWYWLGRVQDDRRKPKDAQASYKKSLEIAPNGEFAAEARARLQQEPAKPAKDTAPKEPVHPESSPPLLPDTVKSLYTWPEPLLKIPPGDGSAAGKLLDEAAKQMASHKNDLALSSIEQIKLKESSSPSAELVGLASAVVYNAMGLPPNALSQLEVFLKEHPKNTYADYAKFVLGVTLLRAGRPDSASKVVGPLPVPPKGALWTEAARQSTLGEALRQTRRPAEAVAAMRLAFQAESETKAKRSLALRMSLEATKAGTPEQALPALTDVLKACDKSISCLQVEVTVADLHWKAGRLAQANKLYQDIAQVWPQSSEAPWAMYQTGNIFLKQGKPDSANAVWKSLIDHKPGSFWAGQARLRQEDALWRERYKELK